MQVSVVICTWNRSSSLAKTLRSLAAQHPGPEVSWEVLVVNNNCTDDTDAVIASYVSSLPIRGVHESTPGLSNARNRGLGEAVGDYIIWTDDDVIVSPGWLCAYLQAFRDWPDHGFFGGPIRPNFEGKPPKWLASVWRQVDFAYAIRDFSPKEQELSATLPFGANFAVRTDLQRSHPYDPKLGRRPDNMFLGGEETALMRRLMSEGWRGRWVPQAAVLHWVPESRQSIQYIRNYCRGQGMCEAISASGGDCSAVFGMPRWLIRTRIERELRYRVARLLAPPRVWIEELKAASYYAGLLASVRSHQVTRR